MSDDAPKKNVVIAPNAFALMLTYAAYYSTSEVHGVLVGSTSDTEIVVSNVFPICHETPTKPLIDTALAMVASTLEDDDSSSKIIGWFTAPELLEEVQPGPVALRIAANLAGDSADKVLLVLNNQAAGEIVNSEDTSPSLAIGAFGKDFGNQWMDPLEVTVSNEIDAAASARKFYSLNTSVTDLSDHLQSAAAAEWSQAAHFCT